MNGHINAQLRNSFTESFERVCHTVLISGYNMALDDDKYDIDWKENSFTNYLASFMRKHEYVEQYYIFIKVQIQKDNNNLPIDEDDPDKQPIIDLWLANWNHIGKNEYFIEAKNLSENDWQKKSGSTVDSSTDVTQPVANSGRYPAPLSFLRKQESTFFADSCFRRNDRVRNMRLQNKEDDMLIPE